MLLSTPRGNLVYQPDGKVLEAFFWTKGFFSCIQGPIGSGTSSASLQRIWRLACAQEPDHDGVRRSRWIVTRRTYKELRETTAKTWIDWFPEDKWGQFIRSEPMVHRLVDVEKGGVRKHPDGKTFVDCEVIFLAIPDADVAEEVCASYEITGFFANEIQFTDKGVIDELLSRTGRYPSMKNGPGATWYGGWADMNAPIEGHWIPYMRGDIPLPDDMGDDEKMAFDKPDNWEFFVQPPALIERIVDGRPEYEPNPEAENQKWLIEPYIEKTRGKTRAWIDRRLLNKVGLFAEGKAVYPTFEETEHVNRTPALYRPEFTVIVGLDFGRDPAAAFLQEHFSKWNLIEELIGANESAERFAPRVKRMLAQKFPNARVEFWGDPRGGDGTQATETTAFDVFASLGMRVYKATNDNSPELRRSTVEMVLERRNGFGINPQCTVAKRAFAGGYHYRKIKGVKDMFSPRPVKNRYSHVVEAVENGLIGGGEGESLVSRETRKNHTAAPVRRMRPKLRKRRARA